MTSKERRQIKHNLKLNVDGVDALISLLNVATRSMGGIPEAGNAKRDVANSLEKMKKQLQEDFSRYIAVIDSYIDDYSK